MKRCTLPQNERNTLKTPQISLGKTKIMLDIHTYVMNNVLIAKGYTNVDENETY